MSKLANKVAIVTGASKGIGAGIAKALAAEGAAVVVNYASSKAGADAVVDEVVAAGGRAVAVQADVSVAAQAKILVEAAVENFGRLDILVNNSGIYGFAPIEDLTEDQYRQMFDINVLGPLLVTQAASPHLADGGSVINISSSITTILMPGSAIYSGTKGALDAISGVLAKEFAPRKIRVNTISPGMVRTEGTQTAGVAGSDMEAQVVVQTPLGRVGQPEDIGRVAVFLASDESGWLTGENLFASGGLR
jgi:3-oxoacyl-[acyl-carrier protein] reductase